VKKRGHAFQVANALASLFVDASIAGDRELAGDLRACREHVRDELVTFHRKHDRAKGGAS
jgi:hypothetical protein